MLAYLPCLVCAQHCQAGHNRIQTYRCCPPPSSILHVHLWGGSFYVPTWLITGPNYMLKYYTEYFCGVFVGE